MCSALCNESVIHYNPDKKNYEKIGESTEVALRILAEKVPISKMPIIWPFSVLVTLTYYVLSPLWSDLFDFDCSYQVGLPGFDSMPSALNMLTKHERASYCNHYWENQFKKVFVYFSLL